MHANNPTTEPIANNPNPLFGGPHWNAVPVEWGQWQGEVREFVQGKLDAEAKVVADKIVSAMAIPAAVAPATGITVHEHFREGREIGDVTLRFASVEQARAFWVAVAPFITPKPDPDSPIEQWLRRAVDLSLPPTV